MRWYRSLRRTSDFAQLRRRGRRLASDSLAAYGLPGALGRPEIGVTVSKAVGGAVVRNLVRRRIRGALDALSASRPTGGKLLLVARPAAALAPYGRLAGDVASALAALAEAPCGTPPRR